MTPESLTSLALVLLFLFGLCVSPCYYIPMSVFSMEFGGPHSGFLIALLDAIAFGALAIFQFFGGAIAKTDWNLFFRSEEHTFELQSRLNPVCCLPFEKKKKH